MVCHTSRGPPQPESHPVTFIISPVPSVRTLSAPVLVYSELSLGDCDLRCLSQHVAIVGAHISQLRLLILANPHIVSRVPVPVLHETRQKVQDTACGTQADERQADAVPHVVEVRSIALLEGICRDDSPNVAEADLPSRSDRSSMVAA